MEGTVGIARASTTTYQTHRSNGKLFYFATSKPTVGACEMQDWISVGTPMVLIRTHGKTQRTATTWM